MSLSYLFIMLEVERMMFKSLKDASSNEVTATNTYLSFNESILLFPFCFRSFLSIELINSYIFDCLSVCITYY